MIKKDNWKKLWCELSDKGEFTSMGRSTYTIQNYLKYTLDSIANLEPINENSIILDCGGGTGLYSWILYPFVKKIYLIDFSSQMIRLARKRFKNQKKIKIFVKDIRKLTFKNQIKFDRIIFGSVLQYLKNYSEINDVFFNLNKITSKDSKILFTHNPDMSKKKIHIDSYKNLKWNSKKIIKSLKNENDRLWIDFRIIKKIALKNNFKIKKKIKIDKSLYGNTHMFDFLLYK